MPSFDNVLRPAFERMQPAGDAVALLAGRVDGPVPARFDVVRRWGASITHRDPFVSVFAGYEVPHARDPGETVFAVHSLNPRDGTVLPEGRLRIGSDLFYPLHYSLTLGWQDLGCWIVAFSALMMLAALVSGVVMHRKVFREFFTFRRDRSVQRGTLDLHNLTGIVALPFHFFFAFTGILIFVSLYFPLAETQLHSLHELSERIESRETGLPRERAGVAAPLASVDAMVDEAQRRWAARGMAGEVGFIDIEHVGDANGYVSVYRAGTDRVASTGEGVHFKASTGAVLREDPPRTAVDSTYEFLTGLHLQHFRHWLLRWLYVMGGLLGCVCIATGFIFFVEKRKKRHARAGSRGSRIVDALAVTTVTGMLIAVVAILVANRLLPASLPDRGDWEVSIFCGTWFLALLHACERNRAVARGGLSPAWREQCLVVGAGAVAAVAANALTTGDHLFRTVSVGYWPVAGVDLALLSVGAVALHAAWRLGRQRLRKASSSPK